jgi:hypothetical protein
MYHKQVGKNTRKIRESWKNKDSHARKSSKTKKASEKTGKKNRQNE